MRCTLIGAIILSTNIEVGLNIHLYDDIGDASSSLRVSTSIFESFWLIFEVLRGLVAFPIWFRQFSVKSFRFLYFFPDFADFCEFLTYFLWRIAISSPPPPFKTHDYLRVPSIVVFKNLKKKSGKILFLMPTTTNRFQIRNLHPKKHRMKK